MLRLRHRSWHNTNPKATAPFGSSLAGDGHVVHHYNYYRVGVISISWASFIFFRESYLSLGWFEAFAHSICCVVRFHFGPFCALHLFWCRLLWFLSVTCGPMLSALFFLDLSSAALIFLAALSPFFFSVTFHFRLLPCELRSPPSSARLRRFLDFHHLLPDSFRCAPLFVVFVVDFIYLQFSRWFLTAIPLGPLLCLRLNFSCWDLSFLDAQTGSYENGNESKNLILQ